VVAFLLALICLPQRYDPYSFASLRPTEHAKPTVQIACRVEANFPIVSAKIMLSPGRGQIEARHVFKVEAPVLQRPLPLILIHSKPPTTASI
jgi:hypothetical protein